MKVSIKNIIFDIGNVLFTYNPQHIIAAILPQSPHKELYLNELFLSDYWQQLDRGDLSPSSLLPLMKETLNLKQHQEDEIIQLITHFPDHLILNNDMKNTFLHLSKHYNVYILSNFQAKPFMRLLKKYPFLDEAHGRVISGNVMMKKPEMGIYHYLFAQFRILPEESLFIDDMPENIATAKKLQLKTILHKNGKSTIQTLSKQNIL